MLPCQRDRFSLPDDLHYLNCAYMSPLSKRVEAAGIEGLRRKRVPSEITPGDFFAGLEAVRERFARLVNADDPDRIAVMPSASYGLAIAARNTPLEAGRNVVVALDQFPSNIYVWRRRCAESGAELRTVGPPDASPRAAGWNARLLEAIDRATAVVALGHVHWTDGTRFDLEGIGARAREVGAALVIDGTQSVGALPFDVDRIRPDALICAGYKWLLGPYAIAVGWFGPRYDDGRPLEETWLGRVGSDDFRRLVDYQDAYRPGALRYDVGEASNFILVPMLVAALDGILEWGVDEIQAYCRALLEPLGEEARTRGWGVEAAAGRAGHILGVRLPADIDPNALRAALADRRIAASLRGDALRVSPHVYNDEDDIAALIAALDAALA